MALLAFRSHRLLLSRDGSSRRCTTRQRIDGLGTEHDIRRRRDARAKTNAGPEDPWVGDPRFASVRTTIRRRRSARPSLKALTQRRIAASTKAATGAAMSALLL